MNFVVMALCCAYALPGDVVVATIARALVCCSLAAMLLVFTAAVVALSGRRR